MLVIFKQNYIYIYIYICACVCVFFFSFYYARTDMNALMVTTMLL